MVLNGSMMLVIAAIAAIASAEPSSKVPVREIPIEEARAERTRLERAWLEAFEAKEYALAEAGLRELIPLDAGNFAVWYNLACVLAIQEKRDESVRMLQQSLARGFADRTQLTTDPTLENIRKHEGYAAILEHWDELLARRAEKALEGAKRTFPSPPYSFETDEKLRLLYISAFAPESFDGAKKQMVALTALWNSAVAPTDPALRGLPSGEGGAGADPMVSVILPRPEDYATWARRHFGERADRVGGAYLHDDLQLVAQDLGSTLRHEYWHVLHWRHMTRLGQRHPLWVMEGLCSLVEDVEQGADGMLVPVASWRTNTARRLETSGGLIPWEVLFALSRERFMGSRPLATYAESRSIFLWLYQQGKLREWYTNYVTGFANDPTGSAAFVATFDKPIKDIEKTYRAWLRGLPEVGEALRPGAARLPFELEQGPGDGLVVVRLTKTPAARASGLRVRDVVTSIDGHPVHDLNDLHRLLGEFEPGNTVALTYRRGSGGGGLSGTATLIPTE